MNKLTMSSDAILHEFAIYNEACTDLVDFLESADDLIDSISINEETYDKVTKRLKLDILDVEKYVKINECKCVSNARAFSGSGVPSSDGLLSNEIFGYTMDERANTYAYIDLHGWFMDPSCYKTWIRLDKRIRDIVHGTKFFVLGDKGELIEDEENGDTGIEFLHKNIKKIQFKPSESKTKLISLKFLEQNRDIMFIQKYIVIPPFYRDKNTSSSSRKTVGLGGINKIYNNLISATNNLTVTQDFGFDASDAMNGRVQELILDIYDWFCGNSNKRIESEQGQGLSGKMGVVKRAAMSKTANFSTRMVISAANLKVNKPEDLMVNFEKSAIPLYAVITQFRDFIMYHVRLFFENEFRGTNTYPVVTKNGLKKAVIPDAPEIAFSDERIKKEMDRFLHGYNNRLVPIEVKVQGTNDVYYMSFKGRNIDIDDVPNQSGGIFNRRLTWCDVFYIAAVEATKDKHVLITRFPIDYYSNQFITKIEVASTNETEVMEIDGEVYKWYPKIREEDIGKDTSNMFRDTLVFDNSYLKGAGADFDGDTCTCKGIYTREANDEIEKFMNDNKTNYITNGGSPLREPGGDVYNATFALTRILSTVNVTPSNKISYS